MDPGAIRGSSCGGRFAGCTLAFVLCNCALFACVRSEHTPDVRANQPAQTGDAQTEPADAGEDTPEPEREPEIERPPVALIVDAPDVLMALERDHGLGFDALLADPSPMPAIERSLKRTLAANRAEDPERTGVGLRHGHRQFDLAWLSAEDTRFELIAVVNRMDRQVFARELDDAADYLGETRLIYRLAYTREQRGVVVDSRLPMTINVVFWQPPAKDADGTDARRAVQDRWRLAPDTAPAEQAAWLRAGALAPEHLADAYLEAVEINVQTERWPATIRPDMAGHAEYSLQVFHRDGDEGLGWRAVALENTPRVNLNPRDRAALLAWLRAPEQRRAIDDGTLLVPERFLDSRAVSVTPLSFAREANRSYSQLFATDDFADYDFTGMQQVRSPAALLRRLDGLTCHGCHESRSIAGFHVLGVERDPDKLVDALFVSNSPHLEGELLRRAAWHESLADGEATSEARPLSEREHVSGAWGTHCGLGDPGFADWTCEPGLACTALADPEVGTCLEPEPAGPGGVCELGRIKPRADHHRDRVKKLEPADQPGCVDYGVCNDNRVGFPGGMCATTCEAVADSETAACGVIPNLRRFNDCLSAGRPFANCIEETVSPAGMRACTTDAPCRDDYICARSSGETGACLPPYFLFQLRVDGHPAKG